MRLFLAYLTACALFGLKFWIGGAFGEPSIDQLMYHAMFAEAVAVKMSGLFIVSLLFEVICFPALAAAGLTSLHLLVARWRAGSAGASALRVLPALAITAGAVALPAQFSAYTYLRDSMGPDTFSEQYVPPESVTFRVSGNKPRNLILIYLESIEDTYSDPNLFGRDLLAPLRLLKGRSFAAYERAPGSTWTIAAMVSTQCGVPLRTYSEQNVRVHASGRSYLAGATCLGDILKAAGYENVFMGGASLAFSGKGTFLRDHGYASTYGREQWEATGAAREDFNEWGMYDGEVFKRARTKLRDLHESGRPFNLTLLTMNTHNPYGYFGSGCPAAQLNRDFAELVACSARQVREFVEFARDRGYLEDTLVVLIGDHLAVPNPVWSKLKDVEDRHIFNRFVGDFVPEPNRAVLVPFDMFPTILEAMGIAVPGGRLGLGYAGFNHADLIPPDSRIESASTASLRASTAYARLWNARRVPTIRLSGRTEDHSSSPRPAPIH